MVSGIPGNTFLKSSFGRWRKIVILLILLSSLPCSCASLYFHTLPAPAEPVRIKNLGELPYRELWQGFVFNGEKVGFMHLEIVPNSFQ